MGFGAFPNRGQLCVAGVDAGGRCDVCVCVCVCVHLTPLPGDEKAGRGRWGRWPEGSSGVSSIHVQSRDPGQRISSELEWLLQAIPDFFRDAAHLKVGY